MRRHLAVFFLLLAILGCGASDSPSEAAYNGHKHAFEGFLQTGEPDFDALYGIRKLLFINRTSFAGWSDPLTVPPAAWFDNLAASYTNAHNYILVDHESYPVTTPSECTAAGIKLAFIATEIKARRPELKVGFYSYPTVRNYTDAVNDHGLPGYAAWQVMNNALGAQMWPVIDFAAPSIYWFYDLATNGPTANDNAHSYFHENIAETIRTRTAYAAGRTVPIYPYTTYMRADGARLLDPPVWLDMTETAYLEGDGVILWSGSGAWDEFASWWINFKATWPFGDRTVIKPRSPRV